MTDGTQPVEPQDRARLRLVDRVVVHLSEYADGASRANNEDRLAEYHRQRFNDHAARARRARRGGDEHLGEAFDALHSLRAAFGRRQAPDLEAA